MYLAHQSRQHYQILHHSMAVASLEEANPQERLTQELYVCGKIAYRHQHCCYCLHFPFPHSLHPLSQYQDCLLALSYRLALCLVPLVAYHLLVLCLVPLALYRLSEY